LDEAASLADAAFAEAFAKADGSIVCEAGCDDCCRRPFAITQTDAERLRQGLRAASEAVRGSIQRRARESWKRMAVDFPGEAERAILTRDADWRDWFFARHAGEPCPVLDPEAGVCLLRSHRPVACRLYGPLLEVGGMRTDPCPKCFAGTSPEAIESTLVRIDMPPGELGPETIIAAAIGGIIG
jgi:Fe-S-cluster containining protein